MPQRRKYTRDTYNSRLKEIGRDDLILLDEYTNSDKPHLFRCTQCGNEWKTYPLVVIKRDSGCPPCRQKRKGLKRRTSDGELLQRLSGKKIELLSSYEGMQKKATFRCLECQHEWTAHAFTVFKPGARRSGGCPKCHHDVWMEAQSKRRLDPEEFKSRMIQLKPHIELLDKYVNYGTKIRFRCKIHDTEWQALPQHLLGQTASCPECVESLRGTDSVMAIINGNVRDENKSCSLYIYSLKNYSGFCKIGIANSVDRRAKESGGQYGDCLAAWEFDTRIEAILVEAVVLQETIAKKAAPYELDADNFEGVTEIRRVEEVEIVEFVQELVDRALEIGAIQLAVDVLRIPKTQKSGLLKLKRLPPT